MRGEFRSSQRTGDGMNLSGEVWYLSEDGIKKLVPAKPVKELVTDKQSVHENLKRQREARTKRVKSHLP